ncbi:MAG: hypothetical protein AUK47_04385 [Deltaproteobacteria bacterium CG2_30_63_29]|nr:MAG: hypothetical protein AUK47_04385 [Deltaproteobacteria bacterium CG2_30_63_29]
MLDSKTLTLLLTLLLTPHLTLLLPNCTPHRTSASERGGESAKDEPIAPIEPPEIDSSRLREHVTTLSKTIGERNTAHLAQLSEAEDYIREQLEQFGFEVLVLPITASDGTTSQNLVVEVPATRADAPTLIVGAHYDSARGTPGADDNATGVAVLLELARRLHGKELAGRVRLIAFTNEEPPYFGTEDMGSAAYVASLDEAQRTSITAMLSLECMGFYSEAPGSQSYPPLVGSLYPDAGNFVAVVGDLTASKLIAAVKKELANQNVAVESIAAPAFVPGIDWSDHAPFAAAGVPALMVTDTAIFRNPNYHEATDTLEKLDFKRLAALTHALEATVLTLVASEQSYRAP